MTTNLLTKAYDEYRDQLTSKQEKQLGQIFETAKKKVKDAET